MKPSHRKGRERQSGAGQILVLFVVALFAIIAMVALVIEGSNLFAQQRIAQNGADAASNAGTIIVAESLSGKSRTQHHVFDAVDKAATKNNLTSYQAEYTDDFGAPIGAQVVDANAAIPAGARGVHVSGDREVGTSFARLLGINDLTASAGATVVAGALSGECVEDEDGCALLPVTFPISPYHCDSKGNLIPEDWTWIGPPPEGADPGDDYWPIVSAEYLPGGSVGGVTGDLGSMAILPLCKGSGNGTGAFGWLDLVPQTNLYDEIEGPINTSINLPDWFQTQTGNANSVESALMKYWRKPVLIPLYNQTCREEPDVICDNPGIDPVGNNNWYFIHTLAVFYIEHVYVQGGNLDQCLAAPGTPAVLDAGTTGAGFAGCLKGRFVNYVTAGPITPGADITPGVTPIGIELIRQPGLPLLINRAESTTLR